MAQSNSNSIVDYLTSTGQDSSPQARSQLFEKYGLGSATDYMTHYNMVAGGVGDNSSYNIALLNKIRGTEANDGILSGTTTANTARKVGNDLDMFTNTQDPYEEYYNKQRAFNNAQYANDVATATTEGERAMKESANDYARYRAGLETLGIQSGLARYAPDLEAGRELVAKNLGNSKIQELQDRENLAIAKAKAARDNNDIDIMKMELDYAKELRDERANAYAKALNILSDKGSMGVILSGLNNTPESQKQEYLHQVADKLGIGVGDLTAGLAYAKNTGYSPSSSGGTGGSSLNDKKYFTKSQINKGISHIGSPLTPEQFASLTYDEQNMFINDKQKWQDMINVIDTYKKLDELNQATTNVKQSNLSGVIKDILYRKIQEKIATL